MPRWHLSSRQIDEVVEAADQYGAWDILADRPLTDFGLVVTAEPDENADPVAIRTSALLTRWGRHEEADALRQLVVAAGGPDTTALDAEAAR